MAEVSTRRPSNRWHVLYITLLVLGILFIIVGVILLYDLRRVVHSRINKELPIRNGSDTYKDWVEPPVPIYMKFWVFDVVNANDFVNNRAKPILKEKGPYTYREFRPKEDIVFLKNGTLVSYREPKTYVFVPEMSNGMENDTFTTINFPLLTLGTMIRFKSAIIQWLIQPLLYALGERLFTSYTVKEYLWGFEDPALQKINNITEKYFHRKLVKQDTFGLFYGPTANGTDDGLYTVYTGQSNLTVYNEIYQWQNKSSLTFWNTEYCNMINGSDGSAWHPFIKKTDTLYLFSSDVCRSVYVVFDKEETVKGIRMYKFSPPASVMQEPSGNPDNIGFCTPDCLKSGVLNISTCRNGAPIIISQPHFYQGDESFINAFEGINPDPTKHSTILNIEPYTGAALDIDKKLQINFYMRKLLSIRETSKLQNDTVFPVVWLSESAQITDSQASEFRRKVIMPVQVSIILPWVIIALGILLFVTGFGLLVYLLVSAEKSEKTVRQPPHEENEEHKRLLADEDEPPQYAATTEQAT